MERFPPELCQGIRWILVKEHLNYLSVYAVKLVAILEAVWIVESGANSFNM